jgi:hypothetical protein
MRRPQKSESAPATCTDACPNFNTTSTVAHGKDVRTFDATTTNHISMQLDQPKGEDLAQNKCKSIETLDDDNEIHSGESLDLVSMTKTVSSITPGELTSESKNTCKMSDIAARNLMKDYPVVEDVAESDDYSYASEHILSNFPLFDKRGSTLRNASITSETRSGFAFASRTPWSTVTLMRGQTDDLDMDEAVFNSALETDGSGSFEDTFENDKCDLSPTDICYSY